MMQLLLGRCARWGNKNQEAKTICPVVGMQNQPTGMYTICISHLERLEQRLASWTLLRCMMGVLPPKRSLV